MNSTYHSVPHDLVTCEAVEELLGNALVDGGVFFLLSFLLLVVVISFLLGRSLLLGVTILLGVTFLLSVAILLAVLILLDGSILKTNIRIS